MPPAWETLFARKGTSAYPPRILIHTANFFIREDAAFPADTAMASPAGETEEYSYTGGNILEKRLAAQIV